MATKDGKTLETVTDKNGVVTRRWKGRKKNDGSSNADKLSGVSAAPVATAPRNAAEARTDPQANSGPHVAGDGLPDDFKPFMDTDNIFIARDGADFVGEMNVELKEGEDTSKLGVGIGDRYGLSSARCVDSEYDGEAVFQFRGNIKQVCSLVGDDVGKDTSSVEKSMRTKYGVDDLDRDKFSVGQRRRARNNAVSLADKAEKLERAQAEYNDAYSKVAEFGEGTYLLPDGRTVSLEQKYRFSSSEFQSKYPLSDNPDMYEQKPKSANELKKQIGKEKYEEMRLPESRLQVNVSRDD